MNLSNWIYVIAIALQMNGALLLLFTQLSKSLAERDQAEKYKEGKVRGSLFIIGHMEYNPKQQKRITLRYWITFLSILVGYPLAVFGDLDGTCKCCIVLLILVFTAIISGISLVLTWPRKEENKILDKASDQESSSTGELKAIIEEDKSSK